VTFDSLGLSAELLRAVADEGFTAPTPIQVQAIPLVLEGRDLMGAAQTGTGKTAAFVLPIFERLKPYANSSFSPARHPVRALVLTPTRELAMQVAAMAEAYGRHVPLRSAVVFGGVPLDPQIKELRAGVELLVATPGRLLDLVGQRAANLGQVEILVLDEGDRMLDMGFIPDIRRILELIPNRSCSRPRSRTRSGASPGNS
jgi:superfamily II DNA/RNA helicase